MMLPKREELTLFYFVHLRIGRYEYKLPDHIAEDILCCPTKSKSAPGVASALNSHFLLQCHSEMDEAISSEAALPLQRERSQTQ